VEELGVDPGPELQDLQEKMLRGDPSLDLVAPAASPAAGDVPVPVVRPGQLPPDVADFTGRAERITELCDLLGSPPADQERPTAVVTAAIAGTAGVGKTALALHVAHRLRDRYPDGQLYANLRGAERREREPAAPGDVLAGFLRALGVEAAAIPGDTEERAVLYRSLLANRQMLVVLDNAATEPQVRPLLPGSPGCAVIVTSRSRLAGLEGVHQVALDVLGPAEAVELLSRVAGPQRVAAEPEAAREVARLCGYLPLAVRISGAKLKARSHRQLSWMSARLGDAARRLDELTAGDLEVRASLALSYEELDEAQRQTFRRLGLLEAQDFPSWVVAALLDAAPTRAEELVDSLVDAQLLEVAGRDATGQLRYRFHDLLRCYARERGVAEEIGTDRAAALERAVGAWLSLAEEADFQLGCAFFAAPHGTAPRWRLDTETKDQLLADPFAWFESERDGLLSAACQSADLGMPEATWDLALSCAGFFEVRGYFDDWRTALDQALAAARRGGHRAGEAAALRGLGELHTFQDHYDAALACFTEAGEIFAELGDRQGQAVTASGCGLICRVRGRYADALAWFAGALAMSEQAGPPQAAAYALVGIGTVHLAQGGHHDAGECFRRALRICRESGYRNGEAQSLWRLGMLGIKQGHLKAAKAYLADARDLWEDLGNRLGQAHVDQSLSELCRRQGNTEEAAVLLTACLHVYRELGDRYGEGLSLQGLGAVHLGASRLAPAAECLEQALRLWHDLGVPFERAKTLATLGEMHATSGNGDAARRVWDEALCLFQELGIPQGSRPHLQQSPAAIS
jgi:tetratricopeptide (TPR) repeat protein